ncbi:MAG: Gfo/Idh/MocA family oxidoreductase [Candidatus Acidiferrales bacterium]
MSHTNGDTHRPRIAVLGAGYWGKNLVRNIHALGALESVCDVNEEVLARVRSESGTRTTRECAAVFADKRVDAVVIAAPAAQHFDLVRRALEHGKHVFVEKPLALRCVEGRELVDLAKRRERVLMVGHILEYHPAIAELKRLLREGELGKIQYIYSSRLNLGKLRTEENILWSFAPHDISVILHLLDESPLRVASQGGSYLNPAIVDTTLSTLDFESGVKAHVFVSWLHPFKEQKLCVIGSQKMAVFDDLEPEKKLVLYAHRINWLDRKPVAERDGGQVIPLPKEEPLRRECQHFIDCVREGGRPRTDGESALRVLEVLDACERSLRERGTPVPILKDALSYIVHASAVVDEPSEIGAGTKIWHFSHIMAGAAIGAGCNVGQNVVISPGTKIGRNVKIQNNVSVYTGVELEDDVFCGPSMVFTNVINPRSHVNRKNEYQHTLVRRGATLGANSTIVCGVTIGRYAFIAAGAVVTRDVPDHALVMGVPGRRVGWMCSCGVRLGEELGARFEDQAGEAACAACGKAYTIDGSGCREIADAKPAALVASATSGN